MKSVWVVWAGVSGILLLAAFLPLETPLGDETRSVKAAARIWRGEGPLLSRLRRYESPQAPMAFLLAGGMVTEDGSGLRVARLICATMGSAALAVAIALGASLGGPRPAALVLLGMLSMPYFWLVSTRFYTDGPALLALMASLLLWRSGRLWATGLCLAAALAARQDAAFAWIAFLTLEVAEARALRWSRLAPLLLPGALVGIALVAIWGDGTPSAGHNRDIFPFFGFKMGFLNYYVACLGAYGGWALWFHRRALGVRAALLATVAVPLFLAAVPGPNAYYVSRGQNVRTLGALDRLVTALVGEGAWRSAGIGFFWIVGALVLARILSQWRGSAWARIGACWTVSFLAVHSCVHLAWDKYFLLAHAPALLALLSTEIRDDEREDCVV